MSTHEICRIHGTERGTEQIVRALGLRARPAYVPKLIKMMAFDPQNNNIDQFIAECVGTGKRRFFEGTSEQREKFDHIRKMYATALQHATAPRLPGQTGALTSEPEKLSR